MSIKSNLFFLLLFFSLSLFSQRNELNNTWQALNLKEYDKAKIAIDKAAENEETKDAPKMWFYRGKTYYYLSLPKTPEKYKNLDLEAPEKAVQSFLNCYKADKKGEYKDSIASYLIPSTLYAHRRVAELINTQVYDKAMEIINQIMEVFQYDKNNSLPRNNITKETLTYKLFLASKGKKDNVKTKEYLQKLIDIRYKDPKIYLEMNRVYLEEKDTAKALTYIESGRVLFEESEELLNEEMWIYSQQKKTDILLEKTIKALEADPGNERMYIIIGTIYENKEQFDKAEATYKKLLEENPGSYNGHYRLGAIYFNKGVEWNDKSNDLKPGDKRDAVYNNNADIEFKNAVIHLEKALEIKKEETKLLSLLKKLYTRLGQEEKAKEIDAKLNAKPQ